MRMRQFIEEKTPYDRGSLKQREDRKSSKKNLERRRSPSRPTYRIKENTFFSQLIYELIKYHNIIKYVLIIKYCYIKQEEMYTYLSVRCMI